MSMLAGRPYVEESCEGDEWVAVARSRCSHSHKHCGSEGDSITHKQFSYSRHQTPHSNGNFYVSEEDGEYLEQVSQARSLEYHVRPSPKSQNVSTSSGGDDQDDAEAPQEASRAKFRIARKGEPDPNPTLLQAKGKQRRPRSSLKVKKR
eukprot:TRINITY_DN94390_c0_g1_i1.p1 TRINITY_DN94390_c0_g1~~TRINITY_DN94390_c0_g1_i1.p1  ORF type:complete len:163 (-),score=26.56 TRINITY_DN94390_c0_g1_i1:195-641(-)